MAVVLGGVHAGVGKSLLASAITAAFRLQGLQVTSYVIGPGLPQCLPAPAYEGKVPQQPVGLDGWLLTADAACAAFHSLSAGSDISIIEGCLGMFDSPSADGSEQGSTAQITQWLHVPVVLVIDTQAFNTVRSIVALIKGYTAVEGGLCIAGIILNKVGNKALPGDLAYGLTQAGLDIAVLGGVPKLHELSSGQLPQQQSLSHQWPQSSVTSAHCNSCRSDTPAFQQTMCNLPQLAQLISQYVDLQQLQTVALRAAVPKPQVPLPPPVRTFRVSMGVAYDEAFFQYYQQNLLMLSAAGVQLVPFSPLHDMQLPPGLSVVLLGGGSVADWAEQLAANKPMLASIKAFATCGGLVMAEGAGLMYTSQSLHRPGQQRHAMLGLLSFHTQAQATDASQPISYVTVNVQQAAHPLLLPGSQIRGIGSCCCHVVEERLVGGLSAALAATTPAADGTSNGNQQSDIVQPLSPNALAGGSTAAVHGAMSIQPAAYSYSYSCVPLRPQGSAEGMQAIEEGYTCGTVLGSCVHVHYGSCPDMVPHIVQRCLRVDVASATAAASAAATHAAALAAQEAAAAASSAAMNGAVPLQALNSAAAHAGQPQQQFDIAGSDIKHLHALCQAHSSRALSAPDLQHTLDHSAGPAGGTSPAGESWMSAAPGAALAYMQGNTARKSASIPADMYQMSGTLEQQHQLAGVAQQGTHQLGMSRNSSYSQLSQQQQGSAQAPSSHGRQPLPLHVPKRWSLELQRLGSFTSQLLPGSKSPTGQQQQAQQLKGHHSRSSSYSMAHLPEEAPLSDAAIKILDSSLPTALGRTHQTRMGVAVPLSNGSSLAAQGGNCAAVEITSGPGSLVLQQMEAGMTCKSSSIHEQMSQLAASLAQQEGMSVGSHWASAAPSMCNGSAVCTECEGSTSCPCEEQQKLPGSSAAACVSLDGAGYQLLDEVQHGKQQQHSQFYQPGQRLSLDQQRLLRQQQQQQHYSALGGPPRMSIDSLPYTPAGLARIQQQVCAADDLATNQAGAMQSHELSFKGMLAHNLRHQGNSTPLGSTDNLLASTVPADSSGMSKSSSSSRLASASANSGGVGTGGIISLSPAATDCLIALGLTSRLSGVTDACRLCQQGSNSSTGCPLAPLMDSLGAAWAKDAAADAAAAGIANNTDVPVICRLIDGPDGLPRYKLDEDRIRRAQPSLVVVACEENSGDEPHVQHYKQLNQKSEPTAAAGTAAFGAYRSGPPRVGHLSWPVNLAGQVSSSMNGAVAVPGRVRLEVSVVQRVLQRAGVIWPEQRAVVLYQRCHSVAEVLEFILVLANAAGVPERGVQLVAGLRARLRAAAGRLCAGSLHFSMNCSSGTMSNSRGRISSGTLPAVATGGNSKDGSTVVMVLESVSPVALAGFWVPEMLKLVGAKQAGESPAASEPPCTVSWAQLRTAAPGVLVLALPGLNASQAALHVEQLAGQAGFWSLPAVQSGAVYVLDHTLLCRPGPGLVLGVELLGHLVAPDKQALPVGLPMGSVLKLSLHSGQRCRPRLVPNYMSRYC